MIIQEENCMNKYLLRLQKLSDSIVKKLDQEYEYFWDERKGIDRTKELTKLRKEIIALCDEIDALTEESRLLPEIKQMDIQLDT